VLDGHIFLSRELADSGHYPAIDIEKSISRVMPKVVSQEHVLAARKIKQLYSRYMRSRDMIAMGAYAPGHDKELDLAIKMWPKIQQFLQQESHVKTDFSLSQIDLLQLARGT
jgi:flagellum-specific ATP synthase